MITLQRGDLRVFTFKEGLLSRVAHDLRLRAAGWRVQLDGDAVVATVPADGLSVEGAMSSGRLDPDALSARDRAKVEQTIAAELLDARRSPEIHWHGTSSTSGDRVALSGTLRLRGVERPLALTGRREGDALVVQGELRPSEWGIAPYKALMGAIKLQDRVRVEARITGWPGA